MLKNHSRTISVLMTNWGHLIHWPVCMFRSGLYSSLHSSCSLSHRRHFRWTKCTTSLLYDCVWVVPWGAHLGSDLTDPLCCLSVPNSSQWHLGITVVSSNCEAQSCGVSSRVCWGGAGMLLCECVCVCSGGCGGCPEKKGPIMVSTLP